MVKHSFVLNLRQRMQDKSGQTLVVLLLILVVTLTVGLSIVTRTVTNVRQSAATDRSTRAFSAAEAGVESALRGDLSKLPTTSTLNLGSGGSASSANVTISQTGGTSYQPVKAITKDDVLQLNLGGLSSGSLTIHWSLADQSAGEHQTSCNGSSYDASLEVAIYTVANTTGTQGASQNDYGVTRYAFNPASCAGPGSTGFTATNPDSGTFANVATITIPANSQIMRVRPLFHDASINVTSTVNLPPQSYIITSQGTAGDATRVVKVEKTIGGLPSLFDYALFNGCPPSPAPCTPLTHL